MSELSGTDGLDPSLIHQLDQAMSSYGDLAFELLSKADGYFHSSGREIAWRFVLTSMRKYVNESDEDVDLKFDKLIATLASMSLHALDREHDYLDLKARVKYLNEASGGAYEPGS